MVDIQPVQDIFGLGRLAQTIRQGRIDEQNRGLAEQQAVTRGLQQENLELGIEGKRQTLADLAAGREQQAELSTALQTGKPGESKTLQAINFLKTKDPKKAQELITSTLTNAGRISKFNPQGGLDFVNQELGTSWTLSEETPDTFTVDQGDKKVLINKATGDVIKEFPVAPKPGSGETIRSLPGGGFEIIRGSSVQTKGRTEVDKAFGEEFVKIQTGGLADTLKQVGQLRGAIEALESGRNITGPVVGMTPNAILRIFKPEAVDVRERVEEVVQRNLREVLGAQFTEKEGERLIARAFNPSLEEDVNVRRVKNLLKQMEISIQQKRDAAEFFRDNGTLTGFSGKLPTPDDFENLDTERTGLNITDDVVFKSHSVFGDVTEEDIKTTMENNNLTREQVIQRLEGLGQ